MLSEMVNYMFGRGKSILVILNNAAKAKLEINMPGANRI